MAWLSHSNKCDQHACETRPFPKAEQPVSHQARDDAPSAKPKNHVVFARIHEGAHKCGDALVAEIESNGNEANGAAHITTAERKLGPEKLEVSWRPAVAQELTQSVSGHEKLQRGPNPSRAAKHPSPWSASRRSTRRFPLLSSSR